MNNKQKKTNIISPHEKTPTLCRMKNVYTLLHEKTYNFAA